MAYDNESFMAGLAVGRRLKGWVHHQAVSLRVSYIFAIRETDGGTGRAGIGARRRRFAVCEVAPSGGIGKIRR